MPKTIEGQNSSQENERFMGIDAPKRLKAGQNLYDQEPFLLLVNSVSETTKRSKDKVHFAISSLAIEHFNRIGEDPKFQLMQLLRDKGRIIMGNLRISPNEGLKMLEALEKYPYWPEYISQHLSSRKYNYNGDFQKYAQQTGEKPALSYANWATQKLQLEKRMRLVGMEEIFSQGNGNI